MGNRKETGIYDVKRGGKVVSGLKRVRVRVEHPQTGEQVTVNITIEGNTTQAKAVKADILAHPENYVEMEPEKTDELVVPTFSDYAASWLDSRRGVNAKRTLTTYERHVRELVGHIGHKRLDEISPMDVRELYTVIRDEKTARLGRQVNENTMLRLHRTFSQVMDQAVIDGIIAMNPCYKKAPKAQKSKRTALSADDVKRLSEYLDAQEAAAYGAYSSKEARLVKSGHQKKARSSVRGLKDVSQLVAVRIGLATGCRVGEVLALRWRDVNLADGSIMVEHALDIDRTRKDTKNHQKRKLYVDAATVQHLAKLKTLIREVCVRLGLDDEDGFDMSFLPVCPSNVLRAMDESNFDNWFRRWRVEAGFPSLVFHELRHTVGSRLAEVLPIADVSAILGHEDTVTTARFYLHAREDATRNAAALMGRIMRDGDGDKRSNITKISIA